MIIIRHSTLSTTSQVSTHITFSLLFFDRRLWLGVLCAYEALVDIFLFSHRRVPHSLARRTLDRSETLSIVEEIYDFS